MKPYVKAESDTVAVYASSSASRVRFVIDDELTWRELKAGALQTILAGTTVTHIIMAMIVLGGSVDVYKYNGKFAQAIPRTGSEFYHNVNHRGFVSTD